tara:strand:+ start:976 stop:1761 length:786 start_codon:yes stop_codon:yes gene_type:complete
MYNTYKEFGFILMYFLPNAYSLHKQGRLGKTSSRLGTKTLFYFSDNHEELDKHDGTIFQYHFQCYDFNAPQFTQKDWEPPKLKEQYKNNEIVFDKPILTINNKNTQEWLQFPKNYLDASTLRNIFETFQEKYQIIYIRPFECSNVTKDNNQNVMDIGDEQVLSEFPNVIWIKDLYDDTKDSYNELQFKILANSDKHISPAGDCVIPAYFGGDLLIYKSPNAPSANRGVWDTNSWLRLLSDSNILSFTNYNSLLLKAKELWL